MNARREGLSPFRFPDYDHAPRSAPREMVILYQNFGSENGGEWENADPGGVNVRRSDDARLKWTRW